MKRTFLIASTIGLFSATAMADNYQMEARADAITVDTEYSDKQIFKGGFRFHFDEVDTSNHPYYEAAYLERSSFVWARQEFEFADKNGEDKNATAVGVKFYVPEWMLFLGAEAYRYDGDYYDGEGWKVNAGVTPIDGLRVYTTYHHEVDKDNEYKFNVNAKYVFALGTSQYLNVYGSFEDADDDPIVELGADFYINRSTSVGINTRDDGDISHIQFSARHFITPVIFAGGFVKLEDSNGDDVRVFGADGGFRF